jgi:SPX domain protein involved in polyphosphate accumulation
LELYHGRLDKSPGAIALRLRWYGNGEPKLVFVERKTHNDKWTGEVSVKERFVVSGASQREERSATLSLDPQLVGQIIIGL